MAKMYYGSIKNKKFLKFQENKIKIIPEIPETVVLRTNN